MTHPSRACCASDATRLKREEREVYARGDGRGRLVAACGAEATRLGAPLSAPDGPCDFSVSRRDRCERVWDGLTDWPGRKHLKTRSEKVGKGAVRALAQLAQIAGAAGGYELLLNRPVISWAKMFHVEHFHRSLATVGNRRLAVLAGVFERMFHVEHSPGVRSRPLFHVEHFPEPPCAAPGTWPALSGDGGTDSGTAATCATNVRFWADFEGAKNHSAGAVADQCDGGSAKTISFALCRRVEAIDFQPAGIETGFALRFSTVKSSCVLIRCGRHLGRPVERAVHLDREVRCVSADRDEILRAVPGDIHPRETPSAPRRRGGACRRGCCFGNRWQCRSRCRR